MKIAIHHRKGSFSDGWIKYCKEKGLSYEIVSAYDNNIVNQLSRFDYFLWHHSHTNYRDKILAKQLIAALSSMPIKVFPDIHTCWHFDNKLAQKYLFEALGAPLVPTTVYYDKDVALQEVDKINFPVVAKLRGGAGSSNVLLLKNKKEYKRYVNKSFKRGHNPMPYLRLSYDQFKLFVRGKSRFYDIAKYLGLFLLPNKYNSKMQPREKGYVYFQKFIPNNLTDTRIVVVGDKIIGERRGVRENDFRASGSHSLLPDASAVDIRCVKIAYKVAKKLGLQIAVFDFVHLEGEPLIVEVSYGTDPDYSECEGYWDKNFNFNKCTINLPVMIIDSFLTN